MIGDASISLINHLFIWRYSSLLSISKLHLQLFKDLFIVNVIHLSKDHFEYPNFLWKQMFCEKYVTQKNKAMEK